MRVEEEVNEGREKANRRLDQRPSVAPLREWKDESGDRWGVESCYDEH